MVLLTLHRLEVWLLSYYWTGVEKAGAMNDWMIPTGAPQTGSVLAWFGLGTHLKLQVKSLYLGNFTYF